MRIIAIYLLLLFFSCNAASEKKLIANDTVSTIKVDRIITDQKKLPYKELENFKGDTLRYIINNFVDRKEFYKSKPLSVLVKDLGLPIVNYATMFSYPPNDKYLHGITLKFEKEIVVHSKNINKRAPNVLNVYLESALTYEEVHSIVIASKLLWTKEANDFFGNEIIKDLHVIKDGK